jgi:hypothetical protein
MMFATRRQLIFGSCSATAFFKLETRMEESLSNDAWNNFVMNSQPEDHEAGSIWKSAAIAKQYMNLANSGGINSFLTNSWEVDASIVLEALTAVGAHVAAKEFGYVLGKLGVPVPTSSQEERWNLLERHWPDELNEHDSLSDNADAELMRVLERHVREHEQFYLGLE